jgi:hypothetical protein
VREEGVRSLGAHTASSSVTARHPSFFSSLSPIQAGPLLVALPPDSPVRASFLSTSPTPFSASIHVGVALSVSTFLHSFFPKRSVPHSRPLPLALLLCIPLPSVSSLSSHFKAAHAREQSGTKGMWWRDPAGERSCKARRRNKTRRNVLTASRRGNGSS